MRLKELKDAIDILLEEFGDLKVFIPSTTHPENYEKAIEVFEVVVEPSKDFINTFGDPEEDKPANAIIIT